MTYVADDRRRAVAASKQIQPTNHHRSPLGPRNSLDYWQKGEDHQSGVTYYWNGGTGTNNNAEPIYHQSSSVMASPNGSRQLRSTGAGSGLENVYGHHSTSTGTSSTPQALRRPAPFPLTLPPTVQSSSNGYAGVQSSGSLPIYQNTPLTMPRARLVSSKTDSTSNSNPITSATAASTSNNSIIISNNNGHPRGIPHGSSSNNSSSSSINRPGGYTTAPNTGPASTRVNGAAVRDSPIFSKSRENQNDIIWSVTQPINNQKGALSPYDPAFRSHPLIVGPEYGSQPVRSGNNLLSIPIGPVTQNSSKKGDKQRNGRQKPRWGRFMQSFCCCVSPQQEIEKPTSPRPNPSILIHQVLKNGNSMAPLVDSKQNDYSQSPQITNNGSNGTIIPAGAQSGKPFERYLLPQVRPADANKKCLIIDLDETLVHSSFKPVKNADFVIPVEIDGVEHKVYVLKRPYVDEFLARVGERFECVLFTASLAKYADPVADLLDKRGVFRSRLFREACVFHKGNYVKDLARLGRDLNKVMIIDNSPASYAFHPDNAIPVQTWFDDPTDVELLDILPLLERMEKTESVYDILRQNHHNSPRDALLDRSN